MAPMNTRMEVFKCQKRGNHSIYKDKANYITIRHGGAETNTEGGWREGKIAKGENETKMRNRPRVLDAHNDNA